MFHTYNEDGMTFICLSDSEFPPHSAYGFLFDLRDQFAKNYGEEQRKSAIGLSAKNFSGIVKDRMEFFNAGRYDHLSATQKNIEEAHKVMIENLDKVLSRGQKIELLVDKTALMSDRAVTLRRAGTKVKRHYWWKNLKMSLMLVGVLLAIGVVMLLILCGGIHFPDC